MAITWEFDVDQWFGSDGSEYVAAAGESDPEPGLPHCWWTVEEQIWSHADGPDLRYVTSGQTFSVEYAKALAEEAIAELHAGDEEMVARWEAATAEGDDPTVEFYDDVEASEAEVVARVESVANGRTFRQRVLTAVALTRHLPADQIADAVCDVVREWLAEQAHDAFVALAEMERPHA